MRLFAHVLAAIDMKDVTVTVQDGNSDTVEILFDDGDMNWDETVNLITKKNRGKVGAANNASVIKGDEEVCKISITARYDSYISASGIGLKDIMENTSGDRTSTDIDPCNLYATNWILENAPICGEDETLTFVDVRVATSRYSTKNSTIDITAESNAERPISSNE